MGTSQSILQTIAHVLDRLNQQDPAAIGRLIRVILNAERIFLLGAGRSGLVVKAFAMRLMHLGMQAYVAGESTTPSPCKGDAVIIVSSSGKTASILAMTQRIVQSGATLILLTSEQESPLRSKSTESILIPCGDHPKE